MGTTRIQYDTASWGARATSECLSISWAMTGVMRMPPTERPDAAIDRAETGDQVSGVVPGDPRHHKEEADAGPSRGHAETLLLDQGVEEDTLGVEGEARAGGHGDEDPG